MFWINKEKKPTYYTNQQAKLYCVLNGIDIMKIPIHQEIWETFNLILTQQKKDVNNIKTNSGYNNLEINCHNFMKPAKITLI